MSDTTLGYGVYSGYDGQHGASRVRPDQSYAVWFDPPEELLGLRRASKEAALALREEAGDAEIVVLYSGGMDSEWVLESLLAAGVAFTPLVVVYKDGLNSHDIQWARRYVARRRLDNTLWWEIDLRDWYRSREQREIAWNAQTIELAYTAQYKAILAHQRPGRIFVTGYDEPLIVADDAQGERRWKLTYEERHYSVVKFFEHYQVGGVPCWSRFNPELYAAYVTNPLNQLLAANLVNPLVWNSEMRKAQLFGLAFPFMERRPKYTGFEQALDYVVAEAKDWQREVQERQGWKWDGSWSRDVREVWADMGMHK